MDTYFLYMQEQPLTLDRAVAAGNIQDIRSSVEFAEHTHLVAALRRPHPHVLEAVVGKLLGQENGRRIIDEAMAHASSFGRSEIVGRLMRAMEAQSDAHLQEAPRPKHQRQPHFVALVA